MSRIDMTNKQILNDTHKFRKKLHIKDNELEIEMTSFMDDPNMNVPYSLITIDFFSSYFSHSKQMTD